MTQISHDVDVWELIHECRKLSHIFENKWVAVHCISLDWVDFVSSSSQIELFANLNKNWIQCAWKVHLSNFYEFNLKTSRKLSRYLGCPIPICLSKHIFLVWFFFHRKLQIVRHSVLTMFNLKLNEKDKIPQTTRSQAAHSFWNFIFDVNVQRVHHKHCSTRDNRPAKSIAYRIE